MANKLNLYFGWAALPVAWSTIKTIQRALLKCRATLLHRPTRLEPVPRIWAPCLRQGRATQLEYLEECRQKMRRAKLPDAGDAYGTLFDALAGSLGHLEPEMAERCAMLAVTPEDSRMPWMVRSTGSQSRLRTNSRMIGCGYIHAAA